MFDRTRRSRFRIDLTPLIDVVFQLLVFFMVTSSFKNPAALLQLPKSGLTVASVPDAISVTVDNQGRIFVNRDEVSLDQFPEVLKREMANAGNRNINFSGDRRMNYERYVDLMEMARDQGAKQFNVVRLPKEP